MAVQKSKALSTWSSYGAEIFCNVSRNSLAFQTYHVRLDGATYFFRKSSYVLKMRFFCWKNEIFLWNVTFLENIALFLSKSEKNNTQTVSGGKRQGKVYGIVTPVFDESSFQLRKKTLVLTSRSECFCGILSLFGAIARLKSGLRCVHENGRKMELQNWISLEL